MKKILVADDNPAILDAIKIIFEEAGYEVETTEDGAVALNMKKPFPDLLLLDIWMPDVGGRDVCMYLKSKVDTKHIPIIIMSATKDIEKIAAETGADDFIAKPFQMERLLSVVANHINQH